MSFNKISKAYLFQAVFKTTEFLHEEIINLKFIFIGFWICDEGQFSCLYPFNKVNCAYIFIDTCLGKGKFEILTRVKSFSPNDLLFSSLELLKV
jgi:hypothetical protein